MITLFARRADDRSAGCGYRRKPPTPTLRRLVIAVCLSLAAATLAARADEDHHDVDRAIAAGEVVPLERLLQRIREDFGGRVLKVELERDDDDAAAGWVYEAKVLTPQGSVLKLDYDAKSLDLLRMKGHDRRNHEDD